MRYYVIEGGYYEGPFSMWGFSNLKDAQKKAKSLDARTYEIILYEAGEGEDIFRSRVLYKSEYKR